ncbi:hypothetical protein OKZ62_001870 [Vibrio navarrensis]|nr:hypothetical protein [Vibrio navarrensis]
MRNIELLVKGEAYRHELPVQDGAIAEFLRPNQNRLLIAIPNITKSERDSLVNGPLMAKLHYCDKTYGLIIIFSFAGLSSLDFDCPFNASIIPDIQLDNIDATEGGRLAIEVVCVDSSTREIVALRYVTMSVDMSLAFMHIVHKQLASNFNSESAERWVDKQQLIYAPEELAELPLQIYHLGLR